MKSADAVVDQRRRETPRITPTGSLLIFGAESQTGEAATKQNPDRRHAFGGNACAVRVASPATGESVRAGPAHSRPSGL